MLVRNNSLAAGVFLLILALAVRGLFLEYTDLLDPTEARYANVAQEMILSGDWITPQIHMPEGVVPYLGKPPLHFWITGIFYKVFGMEEWTSRLASFLAAAGIILLLFKLGNTLFKYETGLVSAMIAFSSFMFFYLAGASVIDVTLTALVTAAIYFLYLFVTVDNFLGSRVYYAAFFTALAFLCKGPIAIVLVFLPLVIFSFIRKDFSWIKKISWLKSSFIFLLVAAPWFVLSEIQNPGFLKYFIWNENIARYLFKDYGDKYGSGHVYMHGSSWIMLLIAFLPWTLILLYKFVRIGFKETKTFILSDRHITFIFAWVISTPLFFTFVRQLHAMYILPAIPPLAILTALILEKRPIIWTINCFKKYSLASIAALAVLIITCSILQDFSNVLIIMLGFLYLLGITLIWRQKTTIHNLQVISSFFAFFVSFYIIAMVCYTPYINNRRSAENILEELSQRYAGGSVIPKIGMISHKIFSHVWTANAWETELKSKIDIKYIDPLQIQNSDIGYVLLREKNEMIPPEVTKDFTIFIDNGAWKLFKRKTLIH